MAEKIERKYMAHMIDTDRSSGQSWYWLGDDLDEYSVELNAEVEIERDMLGNEYIIHDYYEPESESDVFYARNGDKMFTFLQDIIDNMYTVNKCSTYSLDVHMWEDPEYVAYVSATSDHTKNPKKLGWYEYVNGEFVHTSDTHVYANKEYYYEEYPAIRRRCYIIPKSFGGDTSGYQIPFSIKYYESEDYPIVHGKYAPSLKEFTEN